MMRSTVCGLDVRLERSHFTGKERDTESGNDYFEARYYSSAMITYAIFRTFDLPWKPVGWYKREERDL
jgi:hypothetical protein